MKTNEINILVVDNDKSIARAIGEIITNRTHCNVDIAYGGKECLEMMEKSKRPYDLLVLDIMMPFVNGIDVCEAMGKNEKLKNIPALLASALPVSSETFLGSMEKISELKTVKGVLEKPFLINELLDKIESIIGKVNRKAGTKVEVT